MRQHAFIENEARGKFGEHERCIRVVRGVIRSAFFLCQTQKSDKVDLTLGLDFSFELFMCNFYLPGNTIKHDTKLYK